MENHSPRPDVGTGVPQDERPSPGETGWFMVINLRDGQVGVLGDSAAYRQQRRREEDERAAEREREHADACAQLEAWVDEAQEEFDELPEDEHDRALYDVPWQEGLAFARERRAYWRAIRSRGATLRLVDARHRRRHVRRPDHARARRAPAARRAAGVRSGSDPGDGGGPGEPPHAVPASFEVVAEHLAAHAAGHDAAVTGEIEVEGHTAVYPCGLPLLERVGHGWRRPVQSVVAS